MLQKPNFTMPFNVTGYPAMRSAAAMARAGCRWRIQIVGKPFQEATVFQAGHAYETAHDWRSKRPSLAS